jgi:hypothetical protein
MRVILLAESEVERARSVIRSSLLAASDSDISVTNSFELIPTASIKSRSKNRGSQSVIRIKARHNSFSALFSGSALVMHLG